MAGKFDTAVVNSLLECSICLEEFEDPRSLPCLHSFCLRCVKSHSRSTSNSGGNFRCPQCREKCVIPEGGVETFPRNFFANSLKDIVPSSRRSTVELEYVDAPEGAEGPTHCKNTNYGTEQHGQATVFCVQCGDYFCERCSDSHKLFDSTQSHTLLPANEKKVKLQELRSPNCDIHKTYEVDWYCQTCTVPACPGCILESHRTHDVEKLSTVAELFKQDLQDVAKLAGKRISILQQISRDLDSSRMQMEEDLDRASKDISDTAGGMHALISQQEATLQAKVKKVREAARKQMEIAKEELEISQENTSSLKSCAETLFPATTEFAFCTVLQAPVNKQQFIHQQELSVPSVQWNIDRENVEPGQFSTTSFLGEAGMAMSAESNDHHAEDGTLGEPIRRTILQSHGTTAVCGIAPIYNKYLCVTHFEPEKGVWVYTDTGELKETVDLPGIEVIDGMVTVDEQQGKLAIVNDRHPQIHFVTLSAELQVLHHTTKDLPMVPSHISLDGIKGQLVVGSKRQKRFAVLTTDGRVLSDIEVPIPDEEVVTECIAQTKSGFVVCDKLNSKVHFTDEAGHILRTSTDCKDPWHAVQTSWGHVILTDMDENEIKVFSERGDFLGHLKVNCNDHVTYPCCIRLSQSERLLYIACGAVDDQEAPMEVRTYAFSPGYLPAMPVSRNVTKLEMTFKLTHI